MLCQTCGKFCLEMFHFNNKIIFIKNFILFFFLLLYENPNKIQVKLKTEKVKSIQ